MRMNRLFAAAAVMIGLLSAFANASPITYTLSGIINGTVGTTAFTGSAFTWTITSDTSLIGSLSPGVSLAPATTDSIALSGFGTLTPGAPSAYFDLPAAGEGAFFANGVLGAGIVFSSPALVGYQPWASIGPVPIVPSSFSTITTDHGDFNITGATLLDFQAVGVPEPLTLALFGAGLAGLGVARRRKQRA